jgi:hypothetical protein
MPVDKYWTQFKIFSSKALREHWLDSQTALRSVYHAANMVVPPPVGTPPGYSKIDEFYHRPPFTNEDTYPNIAMALAPLVTATGSERATVAALTKALAELTAFTESQSAELRRLAGLDTLAGITPTTHVGQGTADVVCGNGRVHTFERQTYKTKNNSYCWSRGYQVGAVHTSLTCTK